VHPDLQSPILALSRGPLVKDYRCRHSKLELVHSSGHSELSKLSEIFKIGKRIHFMTPSANKSCKTYSRLGDTSLLAGRKLCVPTFGLYWRLYYL